MPLGRFAQGDDVVLLAAGTAEAGRIEASFRIFRISPLPLKKDIPRLRFQSRKDITSAGDEAVQFEGHEGVIADASALLFRKRRESEEFCKPLPCKLFGNLAVRGQHLDRLVERGGQAARP